MDIFNLSMAFKPPKNSYIGDDDEYYWADGQMVLTYAYSKTPDINKWIVGYHTLGARKCEKGLVFHSEECARLKWFGSGLKQFA